MSIKLVQIVKKLKVGNPTAKAILLYLADAYNDSTNQCNPAQTTIAEDLEINRTTVVRQLAFLESNGFISRERLTEKGRFNSDNYTLPCCTEQHEAFNTHSATVAQSNTDKATDRVEQNRVEESNINSIKGNSLNGNRTEEETANAVTPSTESKLPVVKKKSKAKKEALKTRPDLTDTEYLTWLELQPEYNQLGVKTLYRRMIDWCQRNSEKPSRARLLKWLDKDSKEIPMADILPQWTAQELNAVNPYTGEAWI